MIDKQEQLIRRVSNFGNGAHIFAPKEWVNEDVLIVRIEKKTIKQDILELLMPNLDKVIGVFLYGSHSRGESSEDSDIDILVIAREKFNVEKRQGIDLIVLPEKEIDNAIKINPILLYSIFKEAKPIINEDYLLRLKRIKLNKSYFKQFLEQTVNSIKSSEEILELDKQTGKFVSNSIIYSLILRLRGIFIINTLLSNQDFSNFKFSKWIRSNEINYSSVYDVYRKVRDDKREKDVVPLKQGEILLNLLKDELTKARKKIK
jgi:predicted nucleotidyltransferase